MEDSSTTKLHIVMFPWFAFGHINPFLHLSNKLASHGVRISFFSIPGNIPYIKTSPLFLSSLNQVIPLTIPPVEGLSPEFDSTSDITPESAELLKIALDKMKPYVKTMLSELQPDVVIFDFAQYWIPLLCSEIGAKAVHFATFPAVSNAYFLGWSTLMNEPGKAPTIEDVKNAPPGFPNTAIKSIKTFQARDFMYLYTRFHGGPSVSERIMQLRKSCDAVIGRTCSEIEGPYINYVRTLFKTPYYPTGPIVPSPPTGVLDEKTEKWLGQFSDNSVVYCNFGSENYLTDDQVKELAFGLELTGMPFFLVLNFGVNAAEKAQARLDAALPEGFPDRVKDRGVVRTGWVQQRHILAHRSLGCFVTHLGYNSMIEAIASGAQIVGLPLKGDQFLNSKVISEELKVGVEVNRRDEDGYFAKEDVVEAVKTVMIDIEEEPAASIRKNRRKWREFLLNKEIEDGYTAALVKEMNALVCSNV